MRRKSWYYWIEKEMDDDTRSEKVNNLRKQRERKRRKREEEMEVD